MTGVQMHAEERISEAALNDLVERRTGHPAGEDVVSVCYSASVSTKVQVESYAQSLCPISKPVVNLIDHDNFLNNCPLSKRNRATFICKAQ